MSQHDLVIDNATFPSTRADINAALQALGSMQYGSSAPSPTYPHQMWADSATNQLKIRNGANTGWAAWGSISGTQLSLVDIASAGIGTASPAALLHVFGSGGSGSLRVQDSVAALVQIKSNAAGYLSYLDGSDNIRAGLSYNYVASALDLSSDGAISFSAAGSIRGQWTAGGYLFVATASATVWDGTHGNGAVVSPAGQIGAAATDQPALALARLGSDGSIVDFRRAGALVGGISVTGSATSYSTSSDYRLKENVAPMSGALDRVAALNPVRFNFRSTPGVTVDGFLAHEVADVVPEAIRGEKDAVDAQGHPIYQGIDQSKLVPLLVAAIQELQARLRELETTGP